MRGHGAQLIAVLLALFAPAFLPAQVQRPPEAAAEPPSLGPSLRALFAGSSARQTALRRLDAAWHPSFTLPLVEAMRVTETLPLADARRARGEIAALLDRRNRQRFGADVSAWFRHVWRTSPPLPPRYADLKALIYRRIDPRFAAHFRHGQPALIGLDEVRWGGVRRDGIPPLRLPSTTTAGGARWLAPSDVVFGLVVNGEARAYPKRILAWHELVTDCVGGLDIAGVYCTLCGAMVAYDTRLGARRVDLGTSGFLYRSNKLMYDRRTQSLWSTLEGRPVIGSLVFQGPAAKAPRLRRLPVVTTTWKAWRERHPRTRVLVLETGHVRDYGEGVAYRSYFATDELMFDVPKPDARLRNKTEVLTLVDGRGRKPLALSTDFLRRHPIHAFRHAGRDLVALTDPSGASRVYMAPKSPIARFPGENRRRALSQDGVSWRVTEAALIAPDGRRRPRVAAHRAFWFGWHAAFPKTALTK